MPQPSALETRQSSDSSYAALQLEMGDCLARVVPWGDSPEVQAFQRLRYDSFVLGKGWIPPDPAHPGCETDYYDRYCYHLGVFQGLLLVAYLRALPWQADPGFMLQHEFADLLTPEAAADVAQEGHIELSRLVVAPPIGGSRSETLLIAEMLFKLVYALGKQLGWDAYYIVLEEAWLRVLNRRFELPFVPLGKPHVYPDGTRTLAAYARCDTMEQSMRRTAFGKYQWYQQGI